jgi:hypothetical protein
VRFGMEKRTPDFFGFGRIAHRVASLILVEAQSLSSAAQVLKILLAAASFEYIPSHFCPQKRSALTFFTSPCATFVRVKFFCFEVASLRPGLCYYRQRSLKIFSTPSGCRKKFFDRRSGA